MNKYRIQKLAMVIACAGLASCQSMVKLQDNNKNLTMSEKLPVAPIGYSWQLNEKMSDEFNGESLDPSKWQDHIKTWRGRPPAEFLPKNVSVNDGTLQVKTSTHPNPNDTYTMAGAAVAGIHQATYGYYEARIKASKTRMSTTFWLHSNGHEDRELGCGKQHAIELDILEAIGGWYNESWTNVMHSNSHYKPTEMKDGKCQGAPYLSKGVKHKTPNDFSDNFHVFSMWWRNPNEMTFYFNGKETGSVKLDHKQDPVPFNGPMSLRMVSETYYWQEKIAPEGKPAYPTEQELDDASINTAFYDYVRSYQLSADTNNLFKDGDFEQPLSFTWQFDGKNSKRSNIRGASYTDSYGLKLAPSESVSHFYELSETGEYQLTVYGKANVGNTGAWLQVFGHTRLANGQLSEETRVLAESQITSTEFAPVSLSFNNTQPNISFRLLNKGNTDVYLDNLSLTKK